MPTEQDKSKEQKAAESEVESFRKDLGPFVVAAETTRMAMVFTDAKQSNHPLIFANDSFLSLAGYDRQIVEDEMIVAWLLEDLLAELGCAIVGPAASVTQALAMIEAEAIDVAVLDVNLNGEMSYPIADVLAVRGVPFVFVTGYNKDRILDRYRTFPVMQKPFHRSELSDTLAKLLAPTSVESVIAAVANTSPY